MKTSFNPFAFLPHVTRLCAFTFWFSLLHHSKTSSCTVRDPSEPHHEQQQSIPLSFLKAFAKFSSDISPLHTPLKKNQPDCTCAISLLLLETSLLHHSWWCHIPFAHTLIVVCFDYRHCGFAHTVPACKQEPLLLQ